MKKLISIFVVFALLTAVAFAQDEGSWSVSSNGTIGTRINFVPMQSFTGGDPGVEQWGHATNVARGPEDYHGNTEEVRGNLNIRYNLGGLTAGLNIRQHTGGSGGGIIAVLSFNGENFQFAAEQTLYHLLNQVPSNNRRVLWGNYTFQVLNGIKLETAVAKDQGNQFATTDILGYNTYTHHDTIGNNYLLLDVSPMAGLNIGFITRQVFNLDGSDFLTQSLQRTVFGAKYADGPLGVALQFALRGQGSKFSFDKDDDVFKDITKNDVDLNAALYLGVSYKINDQMSAGLEFRGEFGGQKTYLIKSTEGIFAGYYIDQYEVQDAAYIGIGAKFDYNDGPFGAGISLQFKDDDRITPAYFRGETQNTDPNPTAPTPAYFDDSYLYLERYNHNQTFEIGPSVYFNVVEGYLQLKLSASLTFRERLKLQQSEGITDPNNAEFEGRVDYNFEPQLYFNFLGTGAGNWDTGIAVRYKVAGTFDQPAPQSANYLQLTFKWKF